MNQPVPHEPPVPEREVPDVPGFRTWRGVYLAVLGTFVAWVLLLALFTRAFS
ncbi:MAG: hypothetical protein MUF80_04365 [Burkholderiales bacterium]|jgi:hypothetical protein|nr:hypothetical protein [Burkholderiales bacterium]